MVPGDQGEVLAQRPVQLEREMVLVVATIVARRVVDLALVRVGGKTLDARRQLPSGRQLDEVAVVVENLSDFLVRIVAIVAVPARYEPLRGAELDGVPY